MYLLGSRVSNNKIVLGFTPSLFRQRPTPSRAYPDSTISGAPHRCSLQARFQNQSGSNLINIKASALPKPDFTCSIIGHYQQ